MSKVKKIVFFTVLSVLILSFTFISIGSLYSIIHRFQINGSFGLYIGLIPTSILNLLLYVTTDTFLIFILVSAIKNTRLPNFTRYTYEEYKAYRDKKKAEKQEKKKAKLQKQLQEIEKTE